MKNISSNNNILPKVLKMLGLLDLRGFEMNESNNSEKYCVVFLGKLIFANVQKSRLHYLCLLQEFLLLVDAQIEINLKARKEPVR